MINHQLSDTYDWVLYGWAIDMIQCIEGMSTIRKYIILIALGKYAAREYVGLREHIDKTSSDNFNMSQIGYGLENCNYHKEKWNWIKNGVSKK